jgi:hypothetical protein
MALCRFDFARQLIPPPMKTQSTPWTAEKWQMMCAGPASTPDITIRVGASFKDALDGELVCSFPETNSKTSAAVYARAKAIAQLPALAEALQDIATWCERFEGSPESLRESIRARSLLALKAAKGEA